MRILVRGIALGVAVLAIAFLVSAYFVPSEPLRSLLYARPVAMWSIALLAGILSSFVWARIVPVRTVAAPVIPDGIDATVRCALALGLLGYGLAKFNMNQFPPPFPWTQDMTVADLSPFRLAWTFFGTSQGYVRFIGVGELVAAALLVLRRTSFVGAILAGGLLVNIAAVDFFYGARGVLPLVSVLGACALTALASRQRNVRQLFETDPASPAGRRAIPGLAYGVYGAGVLGALWIARSEYRFDRQRGDASALGGRWEIIGCEPAGTLPYCSPGVDTSRTRLYLNLWFGNGRMRVGGFPHPFSATIGNRAYSHFLRYSHDELSDSVSLSIFPVPPDIGDTVRLLGKAGPRDTTIVLRIAGTEATVQLRRRHE